MRKLIQSAFFILLCVVSLGLRAQERQIAFPGAEGYGKYSTGGRGGQIVEVTNLLDLNRYNQVEPGSFRAAVTTPGTDPITIVFRVSGIIPLKAELKSGRSNMTIAGQTAPGDGICFKDNTIKLSGENLIIRYVRFRPGDETKAQTSPLNIENAKNVIVDHCSMSWAVEETMGMYDNNYTTVQWCILSEGLYNSVHGKGPRGYGSQWGGQYASYHHNLIAHQRSRSPRINGSRAHDTIALVDFRNNVIFNWGSRGAVYGGEEEIRGGESKTNFINNYYKPGPATPNNPVFAQPSYVTEGNEAAGYAEWYFNGNYMEGITGGMNEDNWLGVDAGRVGGAANIKSEHWFPVEPIATQTAQEAYALVLENAGAILPKRDSVDIRIVAETKGEKEVQGTGIIDAASEVGGWPVYNSLEAPLDTDKDGMPDVWETEKGLNPNDAADGNALGAAGFTNLEIYLNSIVQTPSNVTGTKSPGKKKDLSVYPNPTADRVVLNTSERVQQVELYDLAGKRVTPNGQYTLENGNTLSIGALKPGTYVIKALLQNGQTVVQKVIKQ